MCKLPDIESDYFNMNKLINGDCLIEMNNIKNKYIDLILCDLPYSLTYAKWDKEIDINLLWNHYKRIIKDNGVIALFGIEPFSSKLRISNINMFKYDWIWIKDKASNHLNCRKQPMRLNELISIFYKNQCKYNPQITEKKKENIRPIKTKVSQTEIYNVQNNLTKRSIPNNMTYPTNILKFNGLSGCKGRLHPCQKPINLLEYLIKTYTDEDDIVLDNTMGVGSTCIAAKNLNRNYIGIEKDEKYFKIAVKLINENKQESKI